jgi:hypothetical protein
MKTLQVELPVDLVTVAKLDQRSGVSDVSPLIALARIDCLELLMR